VTARFTEAVVGYLVRRSRTPYPPLQIGAAVLTGSGLELGVVPFALVMGGRSLDARLHIHPLMPIGSSRLAAVICFVVGVPWLASSIYWQHRRGNGTPLPIVPTKSLLTSGPYRFCRNPMALGGIFWLGGWAVLANSPTALYGGVGFFAASVLAYHKVIEERELGARFGEAYWIYRSATPFLLPLGRRLRTRRSPIVDGESMRRSPPDASA
jgi:protein-S-isoprenylcysteine O-methyltransferase Ste14